MGNLLREIGYFLSQTEVISEDRFFQTKSQVHFDNDNSWLFLFKYHTFIYFCHRKKKSR